VGTVEDVTGDIARRNRLAAELDPGERVLWTGKPSAPGWFQRQDWVLVPFSLMWGGFAIFWEVAALSSRSARQSVLFPLWGIPFVLMGLYLIVGRLYVRRRTLERSVYVLTDRRALSIARSWWGSGEHVRSIWLRSFPPVEKQLRRDGSGTLMIGTMPVAQRLLSGETAWPMTSLLPGGAVVFADIADAAEVYQLLRRQLSGASADPR
jgi:hypothetical protein